MYVYKFFVFVLCRVAYTDKSQLGMQRTARWLRCMSPHFSPSFRFSLASLSLLSFSSFSARDLQMCENDVKCCWGMPALLYGECLYVLVIIKWSMQWNVLPKCIKPCVGLHTVRAFMQTTDRCYKAGHGYVTECVCVLTTYIYNLHAYAYKYTITTNFLALSLKSKTINVAGVGQISPTQTANT